MCGFQSHWLIGSRNRRWLREYSTSVIGVFNVTKVYWQPQEARKMHISDRYSLVNGANSTIVNSSTAPLTVPSSTGRRSLERYGSKARSRQSRGSSENLSERLQKRAFSRELVTRSARLPI